MDFLTFASKALDSLAWPIAAIILVVLLRGEISKLAPFLKKLKAGPLEAEFEREIKELKSSTQQAAPPSRQPATDAASKAFLLQLAELHPRSAILESWVRLEAAARTALASKEQSHELSTYQPAARLAESLACKEIFTQGQVTLFHELRRLRNDVAHSPDLSPTLESVKNYAELASHLQAWLEDAAK
jgi:hypothetical protein